MLIYGGNKWNKMSTEIKKAKTSFKRLIKNETLNLYLLHKWEMKGKNIIHPFFIDNLLANINLIVLN